MSFIETFLKLDRLNEARRNRIDIINEIKELGFNYNFDKYKDEALLYILANCKARVNRAEGEAEAAILSKEEIPVCANCNRRLTDGGLCPVCDDGAEDLTEDVNSALTDFIKIIGKHGGVVKTKLTDNSTRFLVVSDLSMHEHKEIDVQIAKDLISTLDLVYDDTRSNELFSFFTFQKNIVENLAKLLHENWADDALADLKSKPRNLWTEEDWETYNYCLNANAERDYYDSLED
jgi:hypothetical protein